MSDSIQLFTPVFRTEEVLAEIRQCLEKGWTGIGYKTVEFEEAWKKYTGLPNACFLNSATAGLHLAMHQLSYGWSDGDEVITTPITFVSTNHPILYERLTPVFADVDQYMCLDPDSVEEQITPRTRAVVFVGLGGNVGQYAKIWEICQSHGLKLILDAAHMAGTRWLDGDHVGATADVSVFSFQAVKNLPTGDSGMICWADPEMDAQSRKLSWMGIDKDTYARSSGTGYSWEYDVENVGWKYNGNSIMAAMGLVALQYLDDDNQHRRNIAALYDKLLAGVCESVPMSPDCIPSRHLYQVLVDNRNEVVNALKLAGVGTGVHYVDNTQYPMYHGYYLPRATEASNRLLSLPMHLKMRSVEVGRVAEELRKAIEGVKTK